LRHGSRSYGEASKKHLKLDLSDAFYQDQYPFSFAIYRLAGDWFKIDREKARIEAAAFLTELEKTQGLKRKFLSSF